MKRRKKSTQDVNKNSVQPTSLYLKDASNLNPNDVFYCVGVNLLKGNSHRFPNFKYVITYKLFRPRKGILVKRPKWLRILVNKGSLYTSNAEGKNPMIGIT